MFIIYHHTKFQIHSSNDLLLTAIQLKAKYKFHAATTLLFYILHKNYLNQSPTFFEALLQYII
jgi:hypothetical protein